MFSYKYACLIQSSSGSSLCICGDLCSWCYGIEVIIHLRNSLLLLGDTEAILACSSRNIVLMIQSFVCCWPFYRGEFKFLQSDTAYEIYDGLEAQPPYTVHREAYDFSCKMPSVLEVNPLPVSSLLKDLFQNKPGLEDVALYFFPSDNSER